MEEKKIKTVKDFQTSINIAFDLYDDRKIKNFIPTYSAIKLIEEILLSTNIDSTQRAKMLVGAYGRGKSHIVLVALSLLFKKDKKIFEKILLKIKEYNVHMFDFINNYLESEKKILPIIISGNSSTLSQSFLLGLQQTLKGEELEDFMPDTSYISAIKVIKNWEEKYPETYERLKSRLNISIQEFILKLQEYDVQSYRFFEKIYPELTSGSSFNPFANGDIVELYEEVAKKLRLKGYSGIYVVYDEFSKYLEGSIENTEINEIKLLQDFAEKCNRSGSLQMHLLLISHKDLSNYLSKNLSKEKIDAWRGVSGRFLEIDIQDNYEQMYEIIIQVIKKNREYWQNFQDKYEKNFEILENSILGREELANTEIKNLIRGCYPLHPLSVFILPRLSERVAQNERTLFTFLSANQRYTLNDYLEKNDEDQFKTLTPDYIFDYFDSLLKKENYNSNIYKNYKLLKTVLLKVEENSLESKILKTIALIYFIEQFEKLAPTQDTIMEIFQGEYTPEEIMETLKNLQEKECIVYLKLSNNYLKIKESSGVDIESEIIKYREKYLSKVQPIELLNNLSFDNYLYPTRYNDENEIVRYFDFIFIRSSDIYSNRYLNMKDKNSDGVIFGVIPASQEDIENLNKALNELEQNKQMVFIVPKRYKNISIQLYRYKCVEELKKLAEEDLVLKEEYELILNDLQEVILNYIDSFIRPEMGKANYFYLGEKKKINRKAHLSNLLSKICEGIFYNTPIINNETINKNSLSKQTINSRDKIISKLLENNLEENLGLKGTGQDVSIMRALLLNNGILVKNLYNYLEINLNINDGKLRNILEIIDNFLSQEALSQWKNFDILYEKLTSPKWAIGLKRGVIPIYLALMIHKYKKFLIIKSEIGEEKIDVDILNKINENPKAYSVYMERWNDNKGEYLEKLAEIFEDNNLKEKNELNYFKYQVMSMKHWYLSLPKYTKDIVSEYLGNGKYKDIDNDKREFLSSLKREIENPREYIFEDIFKIFVYKSLDLSILNKLQECKNFYENLLDNLKLKLIEDIRSIFNGNKDISLISLLKDWEEGLKAKTREHIFNKNENRVLELIREVGHNEKNFVERLARMVSSLRIEDWSNNSIERFLVELKELKITIEEFDKNLATEDENSNNSYKISFVSEEGREQIKSFEKVECSRRAFLLYNDLLSSIDEMGESITQQEIRQILMDILKKYC